DGQERSCGRYVLARCASSWSSVASSLRKEKSAGAMRDARDVWRGMEIGATHRTGNSVVSGYLQWFLALCLIIGRSGWCFATSKTPLYVCKVEKDDEARAAAVGLLARGLMTPGQAARFAGVSRQLVRHWLKAAGIDWKRAWDRRQAGLWRREIAGLQG